MRTPVIDLWPHGQIREVVCCVCRSRWVEFLLGVALREGRRNPGSLCPGCLRRTPAEASLRIRELSRSLRAAIGDVPSPDRLPEVMTGESEQIDDLLRLAHRLSLLECWSLTVEEVISTERRLIAKQFTRPIGESSLKTIVDDRYRRFLPQADRASTGSIPDTGGCTPCPNSSREQSEFAGAIQAGPRTSSPPFFRLATSSLRP